MWLTLPNRRATAFLHQLCSWSANMAGNSLLFKSQKQFSWPQDVKYEHSHKKHTAAIPAGCGRRAAASPIRAERSPWSHQGHTLRITVSFCFSHEARWQLSAVLLQASRSLGGVLGTHVYQALGSLEASSMHTGGKGGELKALLIIMNFINTVIPLYLTDIGSSRPDLPCFKISASALRKALATPNQLQIQHSTLVGQIQMWIHHFNIKLYMIHTAIPPVVRHCR